MITLTSDVRACLADEIARAGGREVSFVGTMGSNETVTSVRPVARGTVAAVLALPGVADRGEIFLHNHPSGALDPSAADLNVAVRLHDAGVGFGIIDNTAHELYVVVEVPKPKSYASIDAVTAAEALGEAGRVAKAMGTFEDRPSQRDMAAYVADTYNDGGVSMLEAGTGVGKSFGYLVPAIQWAQTNSERTIVSTNTINLQEQLVGKDLPLLAKCLPDADGKVPSFALLKGWNNYLCITRLNTAQGAQGSLLEPEWAPELDMLADWASTTNDGSLADLPDAPSPDVWDEVRAEADLCTRLECPHFDRCFVFEARRRAADADVVVVNHHLLAADLAVRRLQENWRDAAVLPPYKRLVLDEGHHLEDVAAKHLGTQITSRGVQRLLSRLERNGRGLIPTLLLELTRAGDEASMASVEILRDSVLREVGDARTHADRVFHLLADSLTQSSAPVRRLDDSFLEDAVWDDGLGVALDNVLRTLNRARDGIEVVADQLQLDDEPDRRSELLRELRGVVRRLQGASDGFGLTLRPSTSEGTVRWMERRGDRPVGGLPFPMGLAAVPLDLSKLLRETLFDRIETIVLTSATLATGGDFEFLKRRLGLDTAPDPVRFEEVLPSPFDFAEQCLFGVPTDLPDPRGDEAGHDRAIADAVVQLAHASDGGMFVLFTSHAQLRRVARLVRESIGHRWPFLVQGEGQRDQLLRRFRDAGSAVLFGTDSFWEGVDVPGRSLRALVLAKLPFRVPSEPLTAARLEALASQGGDGFRQYLLPLAGLKLKQGFGRLIRTKTDVGVVILMDPRIVTKNYGSVLLESLPPASQVVGEWGHILATAEEFFARHGIGAPV